MNKTALIFFVYPAPKGSEKNKENGKLKRQGRMGTGKYR
jgi:hypothetical protein